MTDTATYTFLPWARRGISNQITDADGAAVALRASAPITLGITSEVAGVDATIARDVQIVGPGDVIGIRSDAVVRTEPKHWSTDFEPNYFAHVEFYDEDFPWRYTPARADVSAHRLRPWITLVVLADGEFTEQAAGSGTGAPLASIVVPDAATLFPDSSTLWAWAHVHYNGDLTDGASRSSADSVDALNDALDQNTDAAYSRLICPRALESHTKYHAFLIPTFETGRRAGLGLDIDAATVATANAWGADGETQFPYYYRWNFSTGAGGDFESLARKLKPRAADSRIGMRNIDVRDPGAEIDGIADPSVLGLEGALKSPSLASTDWPTSSPDTFQQSLANHVNLASEYALAEPDGDPVITAPLYGQWHALVERLDATGDGWVDALNLDPRTRAPAAFGTRVVQQNQEQYMASAWDQVGDVLAANVRLRRAQMALHASTALYDASIASLPAGASALVTAPIHKKVLLSPTTAYAAVKASALPTTTLTAPLRKQLRPRGPLVRRGTTGSTTSAAVAPGAFVERVARGDITATPLKESPAGATTFEDIADAAPSTTAPAWLRWLAARAWMLPLVALLVLIVLLVAWFSTGMVRFIALGVLGVLLGLAAAIWRAGAGARASEQMGETTLTVDAVESVPPNAGFRITTEAIPVPRAPAAPGSDSEEAKRFRVAATDLHAMFEASPKIDAAPTKPALDVAAFARTIAQRLAPRTTVTRRTLNGLRFGFTPDARTLESLEPVMAYPTFPWPMYKPLAALSSELLVPNVNLLRANTVSLLVTNSAFIDAYFVGLNHEMGRELLWREYPTDQRGSYFRQFWDATDITTDPALSAAEARESLYDITPIDTWRSSSALGDHENRGVSGESLVLAVRGDLLKRYPSTAIYAQRAAWQLGDDGEIRAAMPRTLDESDGARKDPQFRATIDPDITFIGFDLTVEGARGGSGDSEGDDPGWFFVLEERVGEPRFGFDVGATFDVATFVGGSNAADVAEQLYQNPFRVGMHASHMLEGDA